MQALVSLTGLAELVAARPDGHGGWELVVIRRGRLVGAEVAPRGVPPMPIVQTLLDSAEVVPESSDSATLATVATVEESELLLRWLNQPGTRLVSTSQPWASPAAGAARLRSWLVSADGARRSADPFTDRRRLPVVHQPNRRSSGSRISA
jgi:DNA polymerase-3 subunit epsilon